MRVVADTRVRLVRCDEELTDIVPCWARLFRQSRAATPFQSPGWLEPWWKYLGRGELRAIAVYDGDELVGFAALYLDGGTLRLMGAGNSDYLDILAGRGCEQAVANAVMEQIRSLEWSLCDLDELPPASALLSGAESVLDASVCPRMQVRDFRPSAELRKSLNNSRHRLEREFPGARFETAGCDGAEWFVDAFIRLHEARWSERGTNGVLNGAAVQSFHRATIPRLQREGAARLFVLRADERILAALYCLAHGDTLYYYLGGFDPAAQRVGPGSLLIEYAIGEARREGLDTVDFLRGPEAYKYFWGALDRRNRRIMIER